MSRNSVASIATALTGNFAASGIYQTNASNATNNIVGLTNIIITEEEFEAKKKQILNI